MTYFMRKTIDLIHDDELGALLSNLGLSDLIDDQKLKCKFCREIVTVEDIYALFPESGSIKVVCTNVSCIKKLNNYINNNKPKQQ